MKFKAIAQYCVMLTILATTTAFATNQASAPTTSTRAAKTEIKAFEKDFDFNWNDYSTITVTQAKIEKTEAFIKTIKDHTRLSLGDRQALGKLLYKLGTFYTHVMHQPDLAIERMDLANTLLYITEDKAWNNNHLAYAYELRFAAFGQQADKEKALSYTHRVIDELYPNTKNKEVAFAYCVQGLVANDAKDFKLAETNYKTALSIYEKIPGGKDDQYARAKNRLANIILDQNGRDKDALAMLKQLKKYWVAKGDVSKDPYAARNFISLGQAYSKTGDEQAARNEFNRAIHIYKNVYGDNSALLAKPYLLLASTYKKSGDTEQASLYEGKIATLNKD
jgi:tetratricopeptide (TPR) repeat protein